MRRRILTAFVGVAVVAVVVFALARISAVSSLSRSRAELRLEQEATEYARRADANRTAGSPSLPPHAPAQLVGIYSAAGTLLAGNGPAEPDAPTRTALAGSLGRGQDDGELVAAVPVFEAGSVDFVVRVAEPAETVNAAVRNALWLLVLAGIGAILIAVATGLALVRRLVAPVTTLTDAVARLGAGDFSVRTTPTGVEELDAAGAALNASAQRLGAMVDRERSFTADASHQLRTPLTGIRLELELALTQQSPPDPVLLTKLLAQVDGLADTVDYLLALARDLPGGQRRSTDVNRLLREIEAVWRTRTAAAGRTFDVQCESDLPTAGISPVAATQILEVLLDNAMQHGRGTIRLSARSVADNVLLEVADDGPGISGDPEAIFTRRAESAAGHGIGLSLARSLAAAESARLLLRTTTPHAVFALALPTVEATMRPVPARPAGSPTQFPVSAATSSPPEPHAARNNS